MRITICCSVQEDVDNGPYRTYGLQMGAVRIDDISTHKCTAVSYTHLDVYKRQEPGKNTESAIQPWGTM